MFCGMSSIDFSTTLPTTGIKPATELTGSIIFLTTFEFAILFIPLPANFNNRDKHDCSELIQFFDFMLVS